MQWHLAAVDNHGNITTVEIPHLGGRVVRNYMQDDGTTEGKLHFVIKLPCLHLGFTISPCSVG